MLNETKTAEIHSHVTVMKLGLANKGVFSPAVIMSGGRRRHSPPRPGNRRRVTHQRCPHDGARADSGTGGTRGSFIASEATGGC